MGCTPWAVSDANFVSYPLPPPPPPFAHAHDGCVVLFPSLASLQPNYRIGDPILHIELRRWADIVLVAPCSANTLAKIATGVCDNLVVSPSSLPPVSVPYSQLPLVTLHYITSNIILFLIFFLDKKMNEHEKRRRSCVRWHLQRRRTFTRP
jgi:flavoprotein